MSPAGGYFIARNIPPTYGMSHTSQTKRLYLWKPFRACSLPRATTAVAQMACSSISQIAICPVKVCGSNKSKGLFAIRCIAQVPAISKENPIQNAVTCQGFKYLAILSDQTPIE